MSNGDSVTVKVGDAFKKLFLSSIRPPRQADFPDAPVKADKKNNQLYDVPLLFEAREFLRKKLIGKKVGGVFLPTTSNRISIHFISIHFIKMKF